MRVDEGAFFLVEGFMGNFVFYKWCSQDSIVCVPDSTLTYHHIMVLFSLTSDVNVLEECFIKHMVDNNDSTLTGSVTNDLIIRNVNIIKMKTNRGNSTKGHVYWLLVYVNCTILFCINTDNCYFAMWFSKTQPNSKGAYRLYQMYYVILSYLYLSRYTYWSL